MSTEAQRCHSCGWTGIPMILQVCPACTGRDVLSDLSGDAMEDDHVMPLEYADADEEILNTEEEVEIYVAADTGAVCHVTPPKDLPRSVSVEAPPPGKVRNFVAANNTPIKNHGTAKVLLEQEDGTEIDSSFQVADVSRPLHSVSTICDAASGACPDGHEMLFTKGMGYVVPEGALSKFLGSIRTVARYPRRGGLYVAKMKAKDPRRAKRSSFTRPGGKQ